MFALFSFSIATDRHVQGSRFLPIPAIPETTALISVSLASVYAPTECPWTPSVPGNVFPAIWSAVLMVLKLWMNRIQHGRLNQETYKYYIREHQTALHSQLQHGVQQIEYWPHFIWSCWIMEETDVRRWYDSFWGKKSSHVFLTLLCAAKSTFSLVFERLRKQFPEIILEILPFVMSQSKSMSLWHLFKDKGPPNAPKAKYSA